METAVDRAKKEDDYDGVEEVDGVGKLVKMHEDRQGEKTADETWNFLCLFECFQMETTNTHCHAHS